MINFIRQFFQPRFGGRSPKWRKVRKAYLKKHPVCAVCSKTGKIISNEIHHIVPVNIDKSKELEESNFITLCREHHFLFGHFNSWYSFNKNVKKDAKEWKNKIKNRPKKLK